MFGSCKLKIKKIQIQLKFSFTLHVLPDKTNIFLFSVVANIGDLFKINLLSNNIETYNCKLYFEKGVGGMQRQILKLCLG